MDARSAEVVTVVPEMFFWMVLFTLEICCESDALTSSSPRANSPSRSTTRSRRTPPRRE
ncbi:hypothetical protein ACFV2U_20140 [Streptomyces sp. NPDC059697]|uniref:hypothetical protein n=1 Tax=Streptomyces sp. NPDC059697 TaxID=3346912 RepID=UPI0036C81680